MLLGPNLSPQSSKITKLSYEDYVGHEIYNNSPPNTGVFVSACKLQDALTAHRIKLEKKAASTDLGRDKLYRQSD
jgi:hypothetical protein